MLLVDTFRAAHVVGFVQEVVRNTQPIASPVLGKVPQFAGYISGSLTELNGLNGLVFDLLTYYRLLTEIRFEDGIPCSGDDTVAE